LLLFRYPSTDDKILKVSKEKILQEKPFIGPNVTTPEGSIGK
jgi:hypothetical protein